MASKRSLSQASEALDTSSRRKISLCEYRECVTRCRTWSTSASNLRVWAVAVVMGLAVAAGDTGCRYARARGDFKRRDFCPARLVGACVYCAVLARLTMNDTDDPNSDVHYPCRS